MGYTDPKIILNRSGDVINKEISNFRKNMRFEFDTINARQQQNIKENMRILEQQKQKRDLGDQVWYQNIEQYRPEGGYAEDTKAFLHNMHNKYWDLMNCDTPDCQAELRRIREVPRQLAEQRGAYDALIEDWEAGAKIDGVNPGAIDAANNNSLANLLQYGKNVKKQYNFETGDVEYLLFDEENKPVLDADGNQKIISGSSLVKGALDGSMAVQTYGDPGKLRQEWQAGLAEKADYKAMVQTIDDQSDRYNQQKSKNYKVANDHLRSFVEGGKLDKIMSDSNEMRRSYPVVLKGLMSQATGENPDQRSIDALNGLGLLGEDKIAGTADDVDIDQMYATQAQAGTWQGSAEQQAAVEAYFKYLDPQDGLIKPDEIVTSRKLTDDSYTTAQRASIEKAALKNQGGSSSKGKMTENQRVDAILKIEKKVEEGTATPEDKKILKELTKGYGSTNQSSSSNIPKSGKVGKLTSTTQEGLKKELAAIDAKKENEIGDILEFELNGKTGSVIWNGERWEKMGPKPASPMRGSGPAVTDQTLQPNK